MTEPGISLRGVEVTDPRTGRRLLGPLDLEVAPGETVLVLGASGSGKSTLLDVLSGVVPQSVSLDLRGTATVAGADTAETSVVALSRTVGVVPQDPEAAVCLPVVEREIALTLENHGVDPAAMDERIAALLAACGASALRHRRLRELSGGERQRIATAAALAARPRIVLVDEPTSMLDADGAEQVLALVAGLADRSDAITVVVDHRLDAYPPGTLPARTIVLDDGRIVADGPTDRVLEREAGLLRRLGAWLPPELETAGAAFPAPPVSPESAGPELAAEPPEAGPPEARARPLLAVSDLTVRRRGTPVLTGIGLEMAPGTLTAVLGANGAGKSTLLAALSGQLPAEGAPQDARTAAMIFQNPEHQVLGRTVAEDVLLGLPAAQRHRGDALLSELRLEHLREANPFRLSGGEKRRLSVASALALGRPVLLADEPSYGLDRFDVHRVMRALRTHADRGGAVLLATHDIRQAAAWADRLVVLAGGRIRLSGTPGEVLTDPRLPGTGVRVPEFVAEALRRGDRAALRGAAPEAVAA